MFESATVKRDIGVRVNEVSLYFVSPYHDIPHQISGQSYRWFEEVESLNRKQIQLTLVISTSLISNNRLSRSENLVPAYT